MRLSFFSMASLTAACALVACGRSDLQDSVFSANPSGGLGGEGAAGGTGGLGGIGGTGGIGGSGGGVGGTGNVGATGGFGGSTGFCGDGVLSSVEQCDDGNTNSNDSCLDCRFAQCGDGVVWFGAEQCDDGNFNTADACPKCQKAFCGDGFVWPPIEQCDDGNTNDGDGCSSKCTKDFPGCGNGIIDPGEQCDDANPNPNDACIGCFQAQCGDGFVWTGVEQCDDGNTNDGDGCSSKCTKDFPGCGNGIIDPGEQCDDANPFPNDACINCIKAKCGDGFVWIGVEQCDDGNVIDGDGCSSMCTVSMAVCGNGVVDPGEQCDDANPNPNDACIGCVKATCGDGFVWNGVEECDDGNLNNGDGCSSACLLPKCGDGTLDTGEECDDGNTTNGDGCSSTCKLSKCGDGFVDPNESCDLGAQNADRPALLVKQGNVQFAVRPIDRGANVVTFYAYGSGSSHTGYEVLQGSRIFFYRDTNTGNLNLVFHHGIDFNSSGQMQPSAQVKWAVAGLPSNVLVLVADDNAGELAKSSPTTITGNWNMQNNSDGGALGAFPFPGNYTTTIAPAFSAAINNWAWINGDDVQTSLDLTQTVEITAFSTPSACRLNCSIPACGDGILDGGEVCDDGNSTGGDGCAANCASLN